MHADERMMRHLAYSYKFRKYTNTNNYTEEELNKFVSVYRFFEEVTDPVRGEAVRKALLSSPALRHLLNETPLQRSGTDSAA